MLVFVDESGDTGLKIGQGSSLYFTVAMVVFKSDEEALKVDRRISLLRSELHLPEDYEFHFIKNKVEIRRSFLNAVRSYDFFYAALTVNKATLSGPEFKDRASFYKAVCGVAFENIKEHLNEANVKFDESGDKVAKKELASYIRRKVNDPASKIDRIKKISTYASKGNNLIQLADMICGAVYRSFQNEGNAGEYRQIIKHRENSVLLWPE